MEGARSVFIAALAALCASSAYAEIFFDSQSSPDLRIYENSIVMPGTLIEFLNLSIESSLSLENRGALSGSIFITDGIELRFQNSGSFSGEICMGENSSLIQLVQGPGDLNPLRVQSDGRFLVLVQSKDPVNLSDIMRISAGADKVILDGAVITLGGAAVRMRSVPPPIELSGEVLIDLRGAEIQSGMILLSGASGDGSVSILAPDIGRLHYAAARRDGENIILELGREMDYRKIFDDGRGAFINQARAANSGNRAVASMDRAATMGELNAVMGRSVMFNPLRLMRPARIFDMAETFPEAEKEQSGAALAAPVYISGGGMEIFGAGLGASASAGDFVFSAKGYAGELAVSDELDDFSGKFYGGKLSAFWSGESLWINAAAGLTDARFRTDAIYDGRGGAVRNPKGRAIYGNFDAGARFDFGGGLYASPFAGIGARRESVLYESESSAYARTGASAGFSKTTDGLRYDYEVFVAAGANNFQVAGARIAAWSHADSAGGEISYSIIRDEVGAAHKISIGGKFCF